ncbi:hypothetical protein CC86DRAFT_374401 [Ophiobolus disseminans]|uniref:Heterokaryon incompatibility domain-containing protein n=1 Tax=Ophiobolus disseminans TaxID=1469910 RepID=A0A6A6ZGZ5_9PLEO|nr:hypothetical protein CC86DRAFT_374401 [Ophiobolus disseminans]
MSTANANQSTGRSLSSSIIAGLKPYMYRPLETETKEIRLVQVVPSSKSWSEAGSTTGKIVFRMFRERLESPLQTKPVKYVGLSYAWGAKNAPLRRVYVEEVGFASKDERNWTFIDIRENLFQFLWHFRDSISNSSDTYIWIDQLCINQKDTSERNHQVQLMKCIYQGAHEVTTWLGSSPDLKEAAKRFCSYYYDFATTEYTKQMADDAVAVLLNDAYFSRLWIVQEVLLVRKVRVLCGIHWIEFFDLQQRGSGMREAVSTCALYLIWDSLYNRSGAGRQLATCIERYTSNQCEDPRDRLYGLLGLVQDTNCIEVDYARPVSVVFYDGVKALYTEYYRDNGYFEGKTAGYVATALKLAKNMEMPDNLLRKLRELEPTGDWIHRMAPLLSQWRWRP